MVQIDDANYRVREQCVINCWSGSVAGVMSGGPTVSQHLCASYVNFSKICNLVWALL